MTTETATEHLTKAPQAKTDSDGCRPTRRHESDAEALFAIYQKTRLAKDREVLICALVEQVERSAKAAWNRLGRRVDIDDLTSEGMVEMIRAIDRFDPKQGVPLRAFVSLRLDGTWIDHARSVSTLPRRLLRFERQRATVARQLVQSLGREPTEKEIHDALGIASASADAMSAEVEMLRSQVSLDTPLSAEDGLDCGSIGELIPDPDSDPALIVEQRDELNALAKAFKALSARERHALRSVDGAQRSVAEVGEELGVAEPNMRHLLRTARKRMRQHLEGSTLVEPGD